jgi:hypothetical protein
LRNTLNSGTSSTLNALSRRSNQRKIAWGIALGALYLVAFYLRTSGLFRCLGDAVTAFHPDEPKQILALFNFLNGDYVHYYGSLFYDGYPYGLNHLDEYLLRPYLFLFDSQLPDKSSLYYYARTLRLLYSLTVMGICFHLIHKLTHCRLSSFLGTLLFAISPLPITVVHFATGDIGIDLFCALCFLFTFFYLQGSYKNLWLLLAGFTVGAAFSAKYNGLLVGIVPATLLCLQLQKERRLSLLFLRTLILGTGAVLGLCLFTPHILLETKPTIANMLANFEFIKNYNVPINIINKPWYEKALQGIQNNFLYTVSALGQMLFIASIAGLVYAVKQRKNSRYSSDHHLESTNLFTLSIAIFPPIALLLSLSGKYVVQPFHFSYLMVPLILVTSYLFSQLYPSKNIVTKGFALLIIFSILIESGYASIQDNFFWRLEDNALQSQALPASIYDQEAFYTHRSDPIRSLFLEPPGNSIFRNYHTQAKGPDALFWKAIEVAPVPQVANPIGENWIFINGPSFPRNERMLVIHAENHVKTLKRYLVLPAGAKVEGIGLRSGSFATEASITLGKTQRHSKLAAHQQKVITMEAKTWKTSRDTISNQAVQLIPLTVTVPHNDLWITIFTSTKEKYLYTLFGGSENGTITVPERIPPELDKYYFDALSRIRYLEQNLSWRVIAGKQIPMWEVSIPAGCYKFICEAEGLVEHSEIAIHFEDAKGGGVQQSKQQSLQIEKGLQRVEYSFTKPFAPYQIRFVISGISGKSQILKFKLLPDYRKLAEDFEMWRTTGVQPQWLTNSAEVKTN